MAASAEGQDQHAVAELPILALGTHHGHSPSKAAAVGAFPAAVRDARSLCEAPMADSSITVITQPIQALTR